MDGQNNVPQGDGSNEQSVPDVSLRNEIFNGYSKMHIFRLLETDEVEHLVPCFGMDYYPAGTQVFKEGEQGDFIGFVLSGRLKVTKATNFPDHHVVLATVGANSFVGEFSMLEGQQRTATVVALEPVKLLLLHRGPLEKLFDVHPQTGVKILKGINSIVQLRLQKLSERLVAMY